MTTSPSGAPQRGALCGSATSWRFPRSSQERNQGDTPWDPASRRLLESRRGFCPCKPPPSWAHEHKPKMGLFWQKTFAFPACRSCWLKSRHSTKYFYVISRLSLCRAAKKQFPKASSFGKPKVQVCLFAKREHRAPHGRKHCSLWFLFFRHFFVERQRNGIQDGTANACRRHSVSVRRHSW